MPRSVSSSPLGSAPGARYTRAEMRIGLVAALALCGCAGGGLGGDAGLPADGGPTSDAFDLPDAHPGGLAIQFIDPDHGPFAGGTDVQIRGTGFRDGAVVRVGGRQVEPNDLQVIDSRRISIATPPGDPGPADVEVQIGSDVATLPAAFTYEAMTVSPVSGSVAGGTYVTLSGFATGWDSTTTVTFDGVPMASPQVLNQTTIVGYTPPGTAGTADIRATTGATTVEASRAYTYLATADPFAVGMGGGPMNGTLNVVVVDNNTGDGVPNAFVAVGDPATTPFNGRTDALGQITFSDPALTGQQDLVAAAVGYEVAMFVQFDARDITIFLRQPPPPPMGPIPPAPQIGHILGHILFGDAVSLGSPNWDLVPEPRTPTERKRAYVTTTSPSMFSTSYAPSGWIDYQYDPSVTAWAFDVWARPSAVAVVAVAGLYDSAKDPSGSGVSGFEPFAMGVSRGILVGPGEDVVGVDVVVDTPLDTAVGVTLDHPPLLDSPGWDGPDNYTIRPFVDFGGEGMIHMNENGLPIPPAPERRPNIYPFLPGSQSILLPAMAPLIGRLSDGSYGFIAGAYTGDGNAPYSVRIARGFDDISAPLTIGDFLPTPRPKDPRPDGTASRDHLELSMEGDVTGEPTFFVHLLSNGNGDQLYRILARGDVRDIDIPDLTAEGIPPLPGGEDISWTFWELQVPGASFDEFTYRQLSALYWSAYAADSYWVQFP